MTALKGKSTDRRAGGRMESGSVRRRTWTTLVLAVGLTAVFARPAAALILGGVGNEPRNDPGWPQGAAAVFNSPSRIAWWEGPPFGGGQWHAECRGDAIALNTVLSDFSRIDAKTKRLVVHDGVGQSVWVHPNREAGKDVDAKIDWVFMVWQPANWSRLRELPVDLNPTAPDDAEKGPPTQIDVYTGGHVNWGGVVVPQGMEVTDERLEAHGFTAADGVVLEGTAIDLATKRPLAARMKLESVEPQPKGGYRHVVKAEAASDAKGRWVLKNAPKGWLRVRVEADGYASRIVGHGQFDDQARWYRYNSGLSRKSAVSGRVTDQSGQPLADVQVRLDNVVGVTGGRYESPNPWTIKTDSAGRFESQEVPIGNATIVAFKNGYCRPGLGLPVTLPAKDVAIRMEKAGQIRVKVDFTKAGRPDEYIIEIEPEGGNRVGSWGGSGLLDKNNELMFKDVPPGRYVLHGRPNPSSEGDRTENVVVEPMSGETSDVTLKAR